MTRAEADRLFSLLALESGRPSPPDPYMRAAVRAYQSLKVSQDAAAELAGAEQRLVAAQAQMAAAIEDVTKLRDLMSTWANLSLEYALDAAKAAAKSGWPEMLAALNPDWVPGEIPQSHRDRCIKAGWWKMCEHCETRPVCEFTDTVCTTCKAEGWGECSECRRPVSADGVCFGCRLSE